MRARLNNTVSNRFGGRPKQSQRDGMVYMEISKISDRKIMQVQVLSLALVFIAAINANCTPAMQPSLHGRLHTHTYNISGGNLIPQLIPNITRLGWEIQSNNNNRIIAMGNVHSSTRDVLSITIHHGGRLNIWIRTQILDGNIWLSPPELCDHYQFARERLLLYQLNHPN